MVVFDRDVVTPATNEVKPFLQTCRYKHK